MISFNPPLNETTILNIPFHPGYLTFTATISTGQLDTRSSIQIWSDIPDNSQSTINGEQQEWSPRSFQFQTNPSVASLSIPFRDLIHPSRSHFSFTYRILHPDGRIHWLGEYGRNGSLIVNRYDDRLVLFGDWAANPLGHSFIPKSALKVPLQVFSLSDKIQWRYWDLSNSAPKLLSANDGPSRIRSALFIPSQSTKAAIIPLSPILLTSQDVQVTIHPSARSVYVTSPSRGGLLSLQTLPPDTLIASISSALPSLVSIPDPDNRHALLLANPDRAPARLFVIPLSADSSASTPATLSLPLSPILSSVQFPQSSSPSHFAVSKPTRFIPTSADHLELTLSDFGGAHFSLSPAYDLVRPDGDIRLSLFAKHNRIATPTGHNLLTPPPSPPLNTAEAETEPPPHSSEEIRELSDRVHHDGDLDNQTSQPIESLPSLDVHQEQLPSGQSTPKPRADPGANSRDTTPGIARPVQRSMLRKLFNFVLRILAVYARILSKVILAIFARLFLHTPRKDPVPTRKVRTAEPGDGKTEIKSTPASSAVRTPVPGYQHSGMCTPRNDPVGQKVSDITESLEAVATKIFPELTTKAGEEGKPHEDLGGSYVQEPLPEPDADNDRHGGEWEVVHRPGIVLELAPIPCPPAAVGGETPQNIKPTRLTLGGEESVVKGVKFYLDDTEITDAKVEPLTGPGQEGLWTVEVPRASLDLAILRVF